MNRSFYSLFILVVLLPAVLLSQTITGKLVDQNGNGLAGLQLKLYISPKTYDATSGTDGSFSFSNITDVKKDDELPSGYAVSENYPNPFNPRTRISITLPNSGSARVDIYNLIGQRVCEEIEKYFSAGETYIDLELHGLPNGFYIARITLDEKYVVTKKLMLMYGSQHLSSSNTNNNSFSRLNKTTTGGNSALDTKIDSLVATSSIVGRKTFKNLPSMIGSSLNLGNLSIDRFCAGTPTITYEGKTYNIVQIGSQCWLKENLDVGTMTNGSQNQNNNGIIEKYCYNDNPNNCNTYGALYQWDEAMQYETSPRTQGICPDGWHVPTNAEFQTLVATVNNDGNSLKAIGQGTGGGAGTNTSGFSGLLAGQRIREGYFNWLGNTSPFWSSTESDADWKFCIFLSSNTSNEGIIGFGNSFKEGGASIRCLKNEFVPPNPTSLSSPVDGATEVSLSPILYWNVSSLATSYGLQVSASNLFTSYIFNQSGLTNTNQQISGLANFTKYYWRVYATKNNTPSNWSTTWSFNTVGTIPQAPTLTSPTNNATSISTSPTFTWNASIGATSYTLQISTNNSFSSYVYNQSGLTSTSQQVTGLSNSTQYYWRVNATNSYGTSSWSSTWSFTTLITVPQAPTLSSPIDGVYDVSLSPTLYWNVSSAATSYTLQVSTLSDFSTFVYNQSGLINTNQPINVVYSSTNYYWRVNATNSYGTSGWSNTWTFTTVWIPSGPCPETPTVVYAGKTYNTVQIGTQCWLRENLDVGIMIQGNHDQVNNGIIEKYCYNNDVNNCATYGGLYQWAEAVQYKNGATNTTSPNPAFSGNVQGICPTGWHVSTRVELLAVNNNSNAMKSMGQGTGSGAGTNTSGFSALLAGDRYYNVGFYNLGYRAFFWSSTERPSMGTAYNVNLNDYNSNIDFIDTNKDYGFSVRCLKD